MCKNLIYLVSFVLVLCLFQASIANAVDPSLVGWWKCDGSGNTAIDYSGNGFDLLLHNTTWEDGVFGGALHFHGVGFGYVENFNYSDNSITICAWVQHDAFRIGEIERYVTVAPEIAVIRKAANGSLHFYIKTDDNLRHLRVSDVLREGRWYHVAGIWDGVTQRLYIDGVEIASQVPGGVLGNTSNVEMSSESKSFNGMLDDVRIYNRALTEPEILGAMEGLVEGWPYASEPAPADGAKFMEPNVRLSWTAGFTARSHRLYFGDNFDHVDAGTGGTYKGAVATTSYTPDPLESEKTYYWRVDEFDGVTTYKGDVWSFMTARASEKWTYDGGILVGAYYYPWYGPAAHPVSDSLRAHLVPQQTAELGEYDSSSNEVISKHIDYSHRANIHFWACSWWGPGTNEDNVLKNRILPHSSAGELKYTIIYESIGRLGDRQNPNYSNLLPDFNYLDRNYFANPNWLKINGRPVIFIYVSRLYFNETQGYPELKQLREAHPNLYIIADHVDGKFNSARASKWDAVTVYGAYGKASMNSLGSTHAALDQLESIYDKARAFCNSVNVGFVPAAGPGFNDKGVRDGHNGAPRYFEDDPTSVEGDLFRAMLRDVVVPKHVDPLAQNMLVITSFNEWHEDTQIEPTMGTGGTTNVDDSASGKDYTQGDYYTDYGYLYLDILSQETSLLQVDSLTDALDTNLSFTTGGDTDWFSQTTTSYFDGDAAQSGEITDNQESWLRTTLSGGGTVSFYWKVSSEGNADYLEFNIDATRQEHISGTEDWNEMTFDITGSTIHTLEWRYIKDGSIDRGDDCGWVDKVEWILAP